MKKVCRFLAVIQAIFGIIGSIVLSKSLGMRLNYKTLAAERDSMLTLSIFLGVMLSVSVIVIILYALSEILENQEKILKQLGQEDVAHIKDIKPICSPYIAAPIRPQDQPTKSQAQSITPPSSNVVISENWKTYGDWVCPQCKRINDSQSVECACGASRP